MVNTHRSPVGSNEHEAEIVTEHYDYHPTKRIDVQSQLKSEVSHSCYSRDPYEYNIEEIGTGT